MGRFRTISGEISYLLNGGIPAYAGRVGITRIATAVKRPYLLLRTNPPDGVYLGIVVQ